jgi:hypothetical protein
MKRANGMPRIDVENLPLDEADRAIVRRIMNGDRLRASAPPVPRPYTADAGLAYYVWRMVAFSVSPHRQHWCMPCTADFYTPYSYGSPEQKALRARGDAIEKAVVHSIPVLEWHGIRRWGNAYGSIGAPMVAPDGSIIYR